ncbi:MAG: hypothetical protein ACYDDF_10910 [Thermoplasmatota archaeon]
MITREHVIDLARTGRVAPSPTFHARSSHGVRFDTLAQQLLFTFEVRKGVRPEHPNGYVAFTQNWGREVYRVDFDLLTDAGGQTILIVTGWKVEE